MEPREATIEPVVPDVKGVLETDAAAGVVEVLTAEPQLSAEHVPEVATPQRRCRRCAMARGC